MQQLWSRIKNAPFFIKLFHWEYWPSYIVHFPSILMWLFFAVKARTLFFFTTANPVIETGGVVGESKINILNRIPERVLPKTIFVKKEEKDWHYILSAIEEKQIDFPLIVKPDVGERGFLVEKIKDEQNLKAYLEKIEVSFLIQEFISLPLEISVLYYRLPSASKGAITSICIKKTLEVVGDGVSTIEQLMANYSRAVLQLPRFRANYKDLLMVIPPKGVSVELEPIANHSRGTTFLNGNHYIDEQLVRVFDEIGFQMKDIYYGRFDMKCASMASLKEGKDIKILEFNGIASEPAHIYNPGYSLLQAYRDIWAHWKIIFQISQEQLQGGVEAMSVKEVVRHYIAYTNL